MADKRGRKPRLNAQCTSVLLKDETLEYLKPTKNVSGIIDFLVLREMKRTYKNLHELTGHETGAIKNEEGQIWIGNWMDGIPPDFYDLAVDVGEGLTIRPCAVPSDVIKEMIQYIKDKDFIPPRTRYHAWKVNNVIVVIQNFWE